VAEPGGDAERTERARYPTALGAPTPETITLLGLDLARDVMGTVGFGELAYWLATQRRPTPGQTRVFEAVLAALADHGFTPTAIVTRLTFLSAPESVQGALAAGLLGGGSRFLGVTEDCGRFLHAVLAGHPGPPPAGEDGWDALALAAVRQAHREGRLLPGLGHPVHRQGDPRTARLMQIAAEEGQYGPHLSLFAAVGRVHPQVLGRTLPLNGAGACGAALADLGLPLPLLRGFALLARTAGLIGQLAEELRHPVGRRIFDAVDGGTVAVAPDPEPFPPSPDATGGAHG
jgi:citrate synthase